MTLGVEPVDPKPQGELTLTRGSEVWKFPFVVLEDGIWVFRSEGEKSVLETIEHESDRAIAIVVGSMIESRLQHAILGKIIRANKDVENRMFRPSGPLGSFSAKIDMAYMMNLISAEAHLDLVRLKDIRNDFAHDLTISSFENQSVRDRAKNFTLINTHVADLHGEIKQEVNFGNQLPTIEVKHATARMSRPKERYLLTAQLFMVRFVSMELPGWQLPAI